MAHSRKTIAVGTVFSLALVAALVYALGKGGLVEMVRFRIRSDLLASNAKLRSEIEEQRQAIHGLIEQNQRLKKALVGQTLQFSMLNQTSPSAVLSETKQTGGPLTRMAKESFLNQQIFRALLAEKKRWDDSQQVQYRDILDGTLEPAIVDSQYLKFEVEDNREAFLEIENALHLHKRLIRDVRLFRDEVQYRQGRVPEDPSYRLYDLKFNLAPFARESAIADALQQAMSAAGAGVYPQEAAEVLDRLGEAFINPIQELSEWLDDPMDASAPLPYNYNFYIVFGQKLMDYADTLARQSMIPLAPSALGELDFFSRRIARSLEQLYEAADQGNIDATLLDMEALAQELR